MKTKIRKARVWSMSQEQFERFKANCLQAKAGERDVLNQGRAVQSEPPDAACATPRPLAMIPEGRSDFYPRAT